MTVDWNDPKTPTPSLAEYARLEADDRNLWWRIGCGHHQNLFDAARDRIEELEELVRLHRRCEARGPMGTRCTKTGVHVEHEGRIHFSGEDSYHVRWREDA